MPCVVMFNHFYRNCYQSRPLICWKNSSITHLCSLSTPKEGCFAWTIVRSNFSIRSRTSEQQNHVSSFSSELVDNFKESQGNLDNMFSLRSCGKPCAFSTSNMVRSGWPLLSALFQHFPSFGPDSPQHMLMVSCLSTTRFRACLEDLKLSAKL